jgi:hypothetical protein
MPLRSVHLTALALAAMLAACSEKAPVPQQQAGTSPAPAAAQAQAARSLEMYRQLLQSNSYELAAPIGQEIVTNYPDGPEAKEVRKTLPDTLAKASAMATRRRLERLWSYQSGKESGGEQTTASIYNSEPASIDRVRLVLRRHSAWGQSVYLFSSGKGFECGKPCTVSVRFDEAPPQKTSARLPSTGEPAIFINDDRAFIAKMSRAGKVSVDATVKGKGAQTIVFEVGGYDPQKFGTVPKK